MLITNLYSLVPLTKSARKHQKTPFYVPEFVLVLYMNVTISISWYLYTLMQKCYHIKTIYKRDFFWPLKILKHKYYNDLLGNIRETNSKIFQKFQIHSAKISIATKNHRRFVSTISKSKNIVCFTSLLL